MVGQGNSRAEQNARRPLFTKTLAGSLCVSVRVSVRRSRLFQSGLSNFLSFFLGERAKREQGD